MEGLAILAGADRIKDDIFRRRARQYPVLFIIFMSIKVLAPIYIFLSY